MARKKSDQISSEGESVVMYELVERPDGTIGIGNSLEVSKSEAVLLIRQKRAKHETAPIGVVPVGWEEGENGSSNN